MINRNIAILAAFLVAFTAGAQNRVIIRQNTFAVQGDSVYIDMTVDLNGVKPARNAFVVLIPYLELNKGEVVMDFPAIVINGKNRQRTYRRLEKLHKEPIYVGQVIAAAGKDAPQSYRYTATVPYEPWMAQAGFFLREDQCECNGPLVPITTGLIAGRMENRNPPAVIPVRAVTMNFTASFKVPNPEPVKTRSESGRAYLDFARGQSVVQPGFGNNAAELAKIDGLIRQINDQQGTTMTGIVIDGFASPEGAYTANMTLSGRRVVALKDYLKATYGLRENLFRTSGRGEDWTMLEDLVAHSDASWKDDALVIIRSTDTFDVREKKLMDLQNGVPYRWMLENLFPRLRRSDYEIRYTVIPFTVEQGKPVLETNPALLSLNEMFLIAETYQAGSNEFNSVFEAASQQFPQSDIANLNMAANALSRGDAPTALAYLNKVQERDAVWQNNMGVVHALEGRYAEARAHFTAATGNAEAAHNLVEIEKTDKK